MLRRFTWRQVGIEEVKMLPHQQKVVDEKSELDRKLTALRIFIIGDRYHTLPVDEKDRLFRQSQIMSDYSDILGERITAFPSGE